MGGWEHEVKGKCWMFTASLPGQIGVFRSYVVLSDPFGFSFVSFWMQEHLLKAISFHFHCFC